MGEECGDVTTSILALRGRAEDPGIRLVLVLSIYE